MAGDEHNETGNTDAAADVAHDEAARDSVADATEAAAETGAVEGDVAVAEDEAPTEDAAVPAQDATAAAEGAEPSTEPAEAASAATESAEAETDTTESAEAATTESAATEASTPEPASEAEAPAEPTSETETEPASAPEAPAEAASEPAPVTAVTLGLLPKDFVSSVSTQLVFYAPEIVPLPARPVVREEPAAPQGGTSRRRNRRRGGSDDAAGDESAPASPPRQRAVELITEPQRIKGSTRLEAKKQRRRDGREAGRRRIVVTETEFLARREAVDRVMIVRSKNGRVQIAVLEDNVLVEHYVARNQDASLIGNVYLGRVQNVLPSMEAAFVDIGRGRNAVIYAGEVDWDAYGVTGEDRRIEKVLKSGQTILVQVTKDPIGAKGARLTGHISIPGRYVVYCPGGQLSGISRKLPESERNRLKGILDAAVGEKASVIVRTAAEGASQEELERDVHRLQAQWDIIEKKVKAGSAPQQLYAEPDLTVRIVRDLFTEDFSALVVEGNGQGEDAWDTVEGYVTHVAPHLGERLRRWDRAAEGDLFDKFRVNEQVAKALERTVHLPSGGSLIIDRTEAMTVIDVNTGKFTGTQGNLEATVTSNNLEAAEEIVRQLRLRDIGGIIVIDFIDMVLPANRELLLRRLVESLGRDRTRHQVAEVTSLGLVQMTRKRIGTGLAEAFTVQCETCKGRGYHVHDAPVASQAPSDGGDRDHGRRGGRARSGRSRKGEAKSQESHDQGASTEHAGGESASAEAASA